MYVVTNAITTSGDELVDSVTVYDPPFLTPPVAEPSNANAADEVVMVVVEGELVEVVVEEIEDEVVEVAVDEVEVDDDVVFDVVVVDCAVFATTASNIMAPKLALFVQPTAAEESGEETTSYSAPRTWGSAP